MIRNFSRPHSIIQQVEPQSYFSTTQLFQVREKVNKRLDTKSNYIKRIKEKKRFRLEKKLYFNQQQLNKSICQMQATQSSLVLGEELLASEKALNPRSLETFSLTTSLREPKSEVNNPVISPTLKEKSKSIQSKYQTD